MGKMKEFILSHKKMSIVIGIVCLIIILAVIGVIIFFNASGSSKEDTTPDNTSFNDWDNLIADLEEEPVSELDEVYKDPDSVKGTPYKIAINKTKNVITIYEKDKGDKYTKEIKKIICSVGYDTPTGTFTTSDKYSWKIVNGNIWTQSATRVVGNVLIHSMPYQSKDKGSLIPSYYNQLGRTMSASCIRVCAKDADWILKNCPKGTSVEIFESDDNVERPQAIKVPDDASWDPTDPDKANPWNSVVLGFEGLEDNRTIERGYQFDYMENVTITDTCGNDISSEVDIITDMDVFKVGSYDVTYHVSDATGKVAEKKVVFNVTDTKSPKLCGLMSNIYLSSIADVTKEKILEDVTVLDNNQILPADNVSVIIPNVVEGVNQVTIAAADEFNNVMTTTINVIVDSKAPQVEAISGVSKLIPLKEVVNKEYALSRIVVSDNGQPVDDLNVVVSIIPKIWGYDLYYKVSDRQGNTTTYNDSVDYVDYTIIPSGKLEVTDITDRTQIMKDVVLRCNNGTFGNTDKIEYKVSKLSNGEYEVVYSLTITSALGSKTVTAKDTFVLFEDKSQTGGDSNVSDFENYIEKTPVPQYTEEP